ncbi:MAG: DUF2240 family protein [Candidatus Aenigmarchaeota archaeon]|nr:DUF2240 family protein [Candidatus Aenigmarchaeota archaeon]
MESLDDLIGVMSAQSGKPKAEITSLVEQKRDELSGLVSEEGAAYIVARELGVSLLKESRRQMKAKNLVAGMQSVEYTGRIVSLPEVREFEREGKKGRVLGLILGDETGIIRMPLWNQEIDAVAKLGLKEGDVVAVTGGWVKADNRGSPELRLGRGKLEPSSAKVSAPPAGRQLGEAARKAVQDLKEGDIAEIRACLVQVFRKDPFYAVCPTCGSRTETDADDVTKCKDHGEVKPAYQVVLSGVLDDGTGSIRAVFFRELAEKVFGDTVKGLRAKKGKDPLSVYDKYPILGRDLVIRGRIKKNDFTQNLELVASDVQAVDVRKEADLLLKQLGV